MATSKEKIGEIIDELKEALIENMEASQAEVDAKQRKIKAHYRLNKVKDLLRGLQYD